MGWFWNKKESLKVEPTVTCKPEVGNPPSPPVKKKAVATVTLAKPKKAIFKVTTEFGEWTVVAKQFVCKYPVELDCGPGFPEESPRYGTTAYEEHRKAYYKYRNDYVITGENSYLYDISTALTELMSRIGGDRAVTFAQEDDKEVALNAKDIQSIELLRIEDGEDIELVIWKVVA